MSTPDEIIELAAWELWRADGSPDGVAKRDPYRKQARALAAAGFLDDPIRPAGLVRLRLVHDKLVLSWLHAEAVWRRDRYLAERDTAVGTAEYTLDERDEARRERDQLRTRVHDAVFDAVRVERDKWNAYCTERAIVHSRRQARIDKIRELLYAYVSTEPFPNVQADNPEMAFLDAVRDALTGDAPSEPAPASERGGDVPSPVAKNAEAWCDEHGHSATRCSYCATEDGAIDEPGGAE